MIGIESYLILMQSKQIIHNNYDCGGIPNQTTLCTTREENQVAGFSEQGLWFSICKQCHN